MNPDTNPFMGIAGRWAQYERILARTVPASQLKFLRAMFYSGFSNALQANLEIAGLEESVAVEVLNALRREAVQFAHDETARTLALGKGGSQ
jgi:hypothetical protein